jgi:hypothetical protein
VIVLPRYASYALRGVLEQFAPSDLASLLAWYRAVDVPATLVPATQPSITNPTFDSPTGWVTQPNWTITGGKAVASSASFQSTYQLSVGAVVGNRYTVSVDTTRTAGTFNTRLGSGLVTPSSSTGGVYTAEGDWTTDGIFYLEGRSSFIGTVDNPALVNLSRVRWNPEAGSLSTYLSQSTAASQPWWDGDGVRFVGDYYYQIDASVVQPIHAFVVTKPTSIGAAAYILDGASTNSMGLYLDSAGTTAALNAGAAGPSIACADDTLQIFEAVFNGAASRIAINGGAFQTGNAGSTAPGGFTLSSRPGGTNPTTQTVREIILCSAELSSADRAHVIAYLKAEHGI